MCLVIACDEEERVVGSYQAPGICPFCGGPVIATDVESAWRLCFIPFFFRTKRKFHCALCTRRLVSYP
ncbi:hypothetical protein Cni_G17306 [Canna indica]|uniref:Methionyl-tRNA synthetase n=1 Tax=Canna indica TaxID=4628 RepID=A0AAQ3KGT1_9LILI|nr:hypothetical protein Cni_G17306 [Canna indica]